MRIKKHQDQGFLPMVIAMFGFAFFSATILSGRILGESLESKRFLTTLLFGVIIACIYTGLLAYITGNTSVSTHSLACYSFGRKGAYLVSFLLGATQVGWFGIGIGTIGVGVTSGLIENVPVESMGMTTAIAVCVGSMISTGTLIPDLIRIFKNKKSPVTTREFTILLGSSFLVGFGIIGVIIIGQISMTRVIMGWLRLVNILIPSIGGVIMADYYIIRKGNYIPIKNMLFTSLNKVAIGAWLLGAMAAYFLPGIAPMNTVVGAIIAYVALTKLSKMTQTEIGMQNRM
ncbi:MAG TPA: hypothetical protein GX707_14010 [Epulopiscium sp.]|nr:hypothetical protein [Candidatus Epulonipiscium sp.]